MNFPSHIAIIMDGNGRWAKNKGLPRAAGHKKGVKVVRNITEHSVKVGVKYLTLYTFSAENWNRPHKEVSSLMKLLFNSLEKEIETIISNNIRFNVIGNIEQLDPVILESINKCILSSENNTGLELTLAINYSSRNEISDAVKTITKDVVNGSIGFDDIDEKMISRNLHTSHLPDPDLVIRTGGEYRLSNFLLWQSAYSEIYVTNKYWPSFTPLDLDSAIDEYNNRERRFGRISEQYES